MYIVAVVKPVVDILHGSGNGIGAVEHLPVALSEVA